MQGVEHDGLPERPAMPIWARLPAALSSLDVARCVRSRLRFAPRIAGPSLRQIFDEDELVYCEALMLTRYQRGSYAWHSFAFQCARRLAVRRTNSGDKHRYISLPFDYAKITTRRLSRL